MVEFGRFLCLCSVPVGATAEGGTAALRAKEGKKLARGRKKRNAPRNELRSKPLKRKAECNCDSSNVLVLIARSEADTEPRK